MSEVITIGLHPHAHLLTLQAYTPTALFHQRCPAKFTIGQIEASQVGVLEKEQD